MLFDFIFARVEISQSLLLSNLEFSNINPKFLDFWASCKFHALPSGFFNCSHEYPRPVI